MKILGCWLAVSFGITGAWSTLCYVAQTFQRRNMLSKLKLLHHDERGQGLVEYLLILALVALAATAGMSVLAKAISVPLSPLSARF